MTRFKSVLLPAPRDLFEFHFPLQDDLPSPASFSVTILHRLEPFALPGFLFYSSCRSSSGFQSAWPAVTCRLKALFGRGAEQLLGEHALLYTETQGRRNLLLSLFSDPAFLQTTLLLAYVSLLKDSFHSI